MGLNGQSRLFVECGHTVTAGFRTGVQRVVRSICREGLAIQGKPFDCCIPLQLSATEILPCDIGHFQNLPSTPLPSQDRPIKRHLTPLQRVSRESFRLWKLARKLLGSKSQDAKNTDASKSVICPKDSIIPRAGDLLLLPDAYWANPQVWPMVDKLRQSGVTTAVVVYDLIPHQYPTIYGEEGAEGFRGYIRQVVQHSDIILTISKTVASDFLAEIHSIAPSWNARTPVIPFQLGAEFASTCDGDIRSEIDVLFNRPNTKPPYLMVGTIEARKNHHYALDAMEHLWREGHDARLCIVGQPGWRGESFVERAKAHVEFGRRLQMFHNVNDAELNFAYKQTRGVLFTSISEGFGLPIVESLWYGKPTYVTDIPIHREVGKDMVRYCRLDSPESLARLLANESPTEASVKFQPMGWPQAVGRLFDAIGSVVADRRLAA